MIVAQFCEHTKTQLKAHFKWVSFTICELYLKSCDYILKCLRERKDETDVSLSCEATHSWYQTASKRTQVSVTPFHHLLLVP